MAYQKGMETKTKILKGSKKLFLTEGFTKSTFKKIGEYLNINSNLITYYFSNKKTLAKYVLIDFFDAERNLVDQYIKETYSPMLTYAIRNRVHYQILADNPNILNFYSEAVSAGLLHNIFNQIPYIKKMYSDFFAYYDVKKEYEDSYFIYLELGSEREILLHFKPEMYNDETFIRFITSIFPLLVGIPNTVVLEELEQSKLICSNLNLSQFTF